ncbi:uncharacterized protein LOC116852499 [Odontomachus brunneus]|uniref:uncharacterized protein LOC116852499 n=1 Tax=Odontomachus brunneus TaxID=486640 RepID=UPI0013F19482|nr:uncharacterized protein LOC116852499 [Odontomachus brunneus]
MSNEQDNSLGQYAVVRFTDENSNSMKIIDLVPSSWIYEVDQIGYFCLYPDSIDYHHLDNWLLSLKSAENNWNSYAITIIAYAKDLKQGKRRLKRALKSDNVKSTDDDVCNINEESVMILCKDSLQNQLNVVKPFLIVDESPSTSSSRAFIKTKTKKKQEISSAENVLPSTSIAMLPVINEETTAEILNVQPISVNGTDYID